MKNVTTVIVIVKADEECNNCYEADEECNNCYEADEECNNCYEADEECNNCSLFFKVKKLSWFHYFLNSFSKSFEGTFRVPCH